MADPLRILCIGDSHTAGFPDYDPLMGGDPESSYQFWLEKGLKGIHPQKEYRICSILMLSFCSISDLNLISGLIDVPKVLISIL